MISNNVSQVIPVNGQYRLVQAVFHIVYQRRIVTAVFGGRSRTFVRGFYEPGQVV